MEALIAIITIIWSVLGIILFFKIWGMTNNVKEIHDWILENKYNNTSHKVENSQCFTAPSERGFEELSDEAVKTMPFSGNLKKGDLVTIVKFGTCRSEGIWQGKYAFYPESSKELPNSPYLVNDMEPYLLIPANKLGELIIQ